MASEKVIEFTNDCQILIFEETNSNVESQYIENQWWFNLRDVCQAIGLKDAHGHLNSPKPCQKIALISNECKSNYKRKQVFVNREGVFEVMLRCRAKRGSVCDRFKSWLASDVLPSIQDTGSYSVHGYNVLEMKKLALKESELAIRARELTIREKQFQIEYSRQIMAMFPGDDRMKFHAQETLITSVPNTSLICDVKKLTVTEILSQNGFDAVFVNKNKISLGKKSATKWRETHNSEPEITTKLVNGHSTPVKWYPDTFFEQVISIASTRLEEQAEEVAERERKRQQRIDEKNEVQRSKSFLKDFLNI